MAFNAQTVYYANSHIKYLFYLQHVDFIWNLSYMQDNTPNINHPFVASPALTCRNSAKFKNHGGCKWNTEMN